MSPRQMGWKERTITSINQDLFERKWPFKWTRVHETDYQLFHYVLSNMVVVMTKHVFYKHYNMYSINCNWGLKHGLPNTVITDLDYSLELPNLCFQNAFSMKVIEQVKIFNCLRINCLYKWILLPPHCLNTSSLSLYWTSYLIRPLLR